MQLMNIKKDTISALCPIARRCGGCKHKNAVYASTLRLKQQTLVRLLGRFGHIEKIIGAKEPFGYRNKVQAMFGLSGGKLTSGVYQASEKKLIPSERCLLSDSRADAIILTVRELCPRFKIKAYDNRSGRGYLRHVLVRTAEATGEIMVVLVTAEGAFPSSRSFVNELLRRHPEITTVLHNINNTSTPVFLGRESHILYGDGYITDRLCGLEFRIGHKSFYQVNPRQTEALYSAAIGLARLTGSERVIDAYCGTGTIGLCAASLSREVIGIELNPDAVRDAEENARRNGAQNARFICGDAGQFMTQMASEGESADVVITDPPRAGCSREFLHSLLTLAPERIVYVSCNPETLARDLSILTKGGYCVLHIQGVDMFPFTEHVECVCLLCKHKQPAPSGK